MTLKKGAPNHTGIRQAMKRKPWDKVRLLGSLCPTVFLCAPTSTHPRKKTIVQMQEWSSET